MPIGITEEHEAALEEDVPARATERPLALVLHVEEHVVHPLPDLARHVVPRRAQGFARVVQRGEDRAGVTVVDGEEADDVVLAVGLVELREEAVRSDQVHERLPSELHPARQVHREDRVDVDETRRVLRALEVTAEPVEVVGETREHQAVSSTSTTHVSLLPPPCELLTTSDPLTSATRVSPPVVTYGSSRDRMKGRRSRWLGSRPSSES